MYIHIYIYIHICIWHIAYMYNRHTCLFSTHRVVLFRPIIATALGLLRYRFNYWMNKEGLAAMGTILLLGPHSTRWQMLGNSVDQ